MNTQSQSGVCGYRAFKSSKHRSAAPSLFTSAGSGKITVEKNIYAQNFYDLQDCHAVYVRSSRAYWATKGPPLGRASSSICIMQLAGCMQIADVVFRCVCMCVCVCVCVCVMPLSDMEGETFGDFIFEARKEKTRLSFSVQLN